MAKPLTLPDILKKKQRGEKLVMLTAYDYSFARWLDEAGIDLILVGDSLGMVVQGHATTHRVTMEQMIYHVEAVVRGVRRAFVVADMPFLSYQVSEEEAIRNAGRLIQAGAKAVKLEGGQEILPLVRRLVDLGIPVMGHLGLMPQRVQAVGGYRTQAVDATSREQLLRDARDLEEAGIFSLVLEKVHPEAARAVTGSLQIPTIGIGSGPHCDGQVLVLHDMLGLYPDFRPSFVRVYLDGGRLVREAVEAYIRDVRQGTYPPSSDA